MGDWSRLDELMSREEEIQRSLLVQGRRARAAVTSMDRRELEAATAQQELLARHARELQARRREMLGGLLGPEGASRPLGALLERIPAPLRASIAARRRSLLDLAREQGQLARLNRTLVERSLTHLDRVARILLRPAQADPTYGPPRRRAAVDYALVDRSA